MAIDAGTTGVSVLLVDRDGEVRHKSYAEFPQHFPQPGWVEHDPEEIWKAVLTTVGRATQSAGSAARIATIGITNQRETAVVWERATLRPVHNAIVWQCRRSASICEELVSRGLDREISKRTGLVVDAYFSGTKLTWLMRNIPGLRQRAEAGELAFGTVDTWLIAKLTEGRVHATDLSNASRTMLFNIHSRQWDPFLSESMEVPAAMLPDVEESSHTFGTTSLLGAETTISGVAGDQQSALFGQACFRPGMSKNTYGTGSFVLVNTGSQVPSSTHGMLTSIAWGIGGRVDHAIEGAIFVTGAAIQWMRDGLGIIDAASETGPLAESVESTDGVFFVPALTGLGAPHWAPDARGAITGISRGTTKPHIARAAVEAMAFQTKDVIDAMFADSGVPLQELRVDGGASVMDVLCQFQSDLLQIPVTRPANVETTAMGAAYLAGLREGFWETLEDVSRSWRVDRTFEPQMSLDEAESRYQLWNTAVGKVL